MGLRYSEFKSREWGLLVSHVLGLIVQGCETGLLSTLASGRAQTTGGNSGSGVGAESWGAPGSPVQRWD